MSMITKVGFSTRTLNSNIRAINGQSFRQPKTWSRLERLGDSILNIIDGYKPVVVKGIDKATGEKVALRDDKGRKLINWVRNIKKDNPIIVMLDHLEDPHNFGAIIRTCEALGIDAIIIPNDRNVNINGTVVKTSVGAIYNMPIVRVVNLNNTIEKLKDIGYWIIGTDMVGTDYTKIDYNMPVCLVIGNEGKGISKVIKNNCDFMATIPMNGNINSLNASVSCGIVLSRIVSSRG